MHDGYRSSFSVWNGVADDFWHDCNDNKKVSTDYFS